MTAGLWAGALHQLLAAAEVTPLTVPPPTAASAELERDAFVESMYHEHARGLVRMARLFVDDRNAAEDLVQEAFIRLSRSAHRIREPNKAASYLRSIVLNLARDHNRRGLVSLRHRLPLDTRVAAVEDVVVLAEEHQAVLDALRDLPHRQRDCLILRYYDELSIDEIADTIGVSRNSVKTHLTRGMRALERRLETDRAGAGAHG